MGTRTLLLLLLFLLLLLLLLLPLVDIRKFMMCKVKTSHSH
jgi:hypothetical protein